MKIKETAAIQVPVKGENGGIKIKEARLNIRVLYR